MLSPWALKSWARALCSLAALAGTAATPPAPVPVSLQRMSAWRLDNVADSCQLTGTFGTGRDEVTLQFRQYAPGKEFTIFASGKSLAYSDAGPVLVTEFEPHGRRAEDPNATMGSLPDGGTVFETSTKLLPSPDDRSPDRFPTKAEWEKQGRWEEAEPLVYDRDAEAKITRLRLSGPFAPQFVFELGPMDEPMNAMRKCLEELVTRWGINPSIDETLSRRAAPRSYPGEWAMSYDYPVTMLARHKSGVTHFRLMVDVTGEPTSCVVQNPGNAAFDKITCDIMMRRARLNPALDAAGQPTPSYYVNSIRWLVPR
ncbi:MAG: energy transducer TonB [Croceibacterium sp.]